jgi:ribonuclease HI
MGHLSGSVHGVVQGKIARVRRTRGKEMTETTRDDPLVIFTDGSCVNYASMTERTAKGHGGWAFIVLQEPRIYGKGFCEGPQTNQTMELQAVLEAMIWVCQNKMDREHVLIRSDSLYVINGMISGWRHSAAETDFADVPNAVIWRKLHFFAERIPRLKFSHVKGHAGNKYNEMCDRIASNARRQGAMKLRRAKRR